jgi:hypothetical protein
MNKKQILGVAALTIGALLYFSKEKEAKGISQTAEKVVKNITKTPEKIIKKSSNKIKEVLWIW